MKTPDSERLKRIKKQHPDLPWNLVSGLRHRLVHDYDGINWNIIVEVIFTDLDPFVDDIRTILESMESCCVDY